MTLPTMSFSCLLLSLATAAAAASAAERIQPALMTAEDLAAYMPAGATIETRLDADFSGDGLRDLAFVARNDETRVLKVMVAYGTEVDMGYDPAGEMAMGDSPLGAAGLGAKKGVLIVEDLDGGTTAIQSLYRFRYDPKARRMRLIGDDVTLYSRSYAHDSIKISSNRLTGERITVVGKLEGDAYVDQPAKRSRVPKTPVYMEDAPLPEDTAGLGG
jgi:hypothetical protein